MPRALPLVLAAALLAGVARGCDTPHYTPQVTTYYVGPRGDDSAPGTSPQQAWRTLDRADRAPLQPGDRLLLEGGARFAGNVSIGPEEAGDAERPVVVGSYGEGRATVVATGSNGVSVHNTGGVEIRELILEGRGASRTEQAGINLYLDNREARADQRNVTITDVEVTDFQTGVAIGSAVPGQGFADVTVRRAALHGNKDAGMLTYGPTFDAQRPLYAHRDLTVEQVNAYDNVGDPRAHSRHTGNGIVIGGTQRAVVRESHAHDNGALSSPEAPGGPVGIWTYDSTGVLMEHNTSFRNHSRSGEDGSGFGLDSNVSASTVQYNLSFQNDGAGYYAYAETGNGRHRDNVIRYNISDDDARVLPWKGALTVYGTNVRNLDIYQNTVTMARSPGGEGTVVLLRPGNTDITFRNNLLVAERDPLVSADADLPTTRALFQGNQYHSVSGPWRVKWGDTVHGSLPAWRAATGQEQVGEAATGSATDPCLAGGALPDIRTAADAPRVVPGCPRDGLDLRALFSIDPGAEDFSGRAVSTPPVIGAAQP